MGGFCNPQASVGASLGRLHTVQAAGRAWQGAIEAEIVPKSCGIESGMKDGYGEEKLTQKNQIMLMEVTLSRSGSLHSHWEQVELDLQQNR
jgi:hypothetical protein